METAKENNPLGTESVSKLMVKFSVPSIIAMLVGALYNIVDQLFIGQAVGTLGNAATNVAFPLTTSCIALALLFGIGGASCFNLAMGRGDKEQAPYFMGNSIVMLCVSGLVLAVIAEIFLEPLLVGIGSPDDVLPYAAEYVRITAIGFPFLVLTTGGCHLVRADGSPGMSMFCNIIGAVINTVLDAWFVMVLDMGMAGAAIATVIGQFVSSVVVIVYLCRCKTVKLQKQHLTPSFRYIKHVAAIGMASFFNQLAMMVVQIVINNSLRHYGELSVYGSSIPLAASGIVMKVNQIMFSVVIGLGQGTQPIESFNYGAKKYGRVRHAYRLAITTGGVISVIAFIMFQVFPREIMELFGEGSEEYFEFGVKFFRVFLMFTWLNCVQPITTTFFTSIGKPLKGAFLSLTRQIIFFLPLLVILPLFWGIDGIIYTGPAADLLSGIVTIIMAAVEFNQMKKLEK
ncbi:MAG: MATE family efflux transporter [Oscillospiraceae bacterium]|nr:MATE family efflux transporter [Oscillospiraceae bacterium]